MEINKYMHLENACDLMQVSVHASKQVICLLSLGGVNS